MEQLSAEAYYEQAQHALSEGDSARLEESLRALHCVETSGWRVLLVAAFLSEVNGDADKALDLCRDAVDAAFYSREEDPTGTLRRVLAETLALVQRRGLDDNADSLVEWAFRLGLLYPEVLDYTRRAYGRPCANARYYTLTLEGRVQDPDLIGEFRETQPLYHGDFGYRCDFGVWAETPAEAESFTLTFEHEYGPGGDFRITQNEESPDAREEPCGVAYRGPMHVYRIEG